MDKLKININGRELNAFNGQTVLQAARQNGIYIPSLCYSDHFEPYASCGICLVEIEGAPKPLRACATAVSNGMIVRTESDKIKKGRKMALELMLSDHRGDCRGPCVMACPANCDAQGYVALAANGMFKEALKLVKEFMPFPGSIGRVCPAPCEKDCRRGLLEGAVSIRYIKRLLADLDMASDEPYVPEVAASTNKRIAIVGSGPAGLTAAFFLRRMGHTVTVFEALPQAGGMLRYGIPEYRLPKKVLDWEISQIERLGVEIKTNMQLGEDFTINCLKKQGFDAIYVAIGAQSSKKMGIQGEEMKGVIGGADFLRSMFLNGETVIGKRVAVVGGGNVAMDAVRTSVRLGAEKAMIIYRRGWDEMPAQKIEIHEAKEEGVEFYLLTAPVKVEGNGKVQKLICQQMELGKPDASGRRRPQPIPDAFIELEVDTIIAAIGQDVEVDNLKEEVEISKYSTISIDKTTFATNMPGVFAGGDAVTGPDDAIVAIAAGKRAAIIIDQYIDAHTLKLPGNFNSKIENITAEHFSKLPSNPKASMPVLPPEIRMVNFEEVELGISPEMALADGARCLECGCLDAFECKLRQFSDDYSATTDRITGTMHEYEKTQHPFITREQDKCILCGLCVQTCSKVVGVEALGLVNRGFETYVGPAVDKPLAETSCISCGQCISICPTGALCENIPVDKKAAWDLDSVLTTCGFCGVGCKIRIETKGDKIVRVLPATETSLLCHRGRFGFEHINDDLRIVKPMLRQRGELNPVDNESIFKFLTGKIKAVKALHGGESIAVLAGPRYTNEELYMIQKFARMVLGTNNISSISEHTDSLGDLFGSDVSSTSYEELEASDFVLAVGVDIKDYPVMAMHIRKAYLSGAKLYLVDGRDSALSKDSTKFIRLNENTNTGVFTALAKQIIENGNANIGFIDKFADGFGELKSWLADKSFDALLNGSGISQSDISELAISFAKAKNPIIVVGGKRLSADSVAILSTISAVTGKVGLPRRGVIFMKERCNSQGLSDMGISHVNLPGYAQIEDSAALSRFASRWNTVLNSNIGRDYSQILSGIENGEIKAVFVFGENPDAETLNILRKAELLVVQDILPTALTKIADCVLPAASFSETEGSFTNSGRKIQKVSQSLSPVSGTSNVQMLFSLMDALNFRHKNTTIKDIRREIAGLVPQYGQLAELDDKNSIWWNDSPYSDIEKSAKIKLSVYDVNKNALRDNAATDSMLSKYYEELDKKGLAHIK